MASGAHGAATSVTPRCRSISTTLLAAGDVLVQPFVTAVARDGEMSVVLFDGRFSHTLHKRPAEGEYRVQEHLGGTTELVDPNPGLVELAERVSRGVADADAVRAHRSRVVRRDSWHVIEAEVTEPSLWLDLAPSAATERLADEILALAIPVREHPSVITHL